MRAYFGPAVAISFLLATCVSLHSNEDAAAVSPDMRSQYKSAYLHVAGPRLVTASGREVALHGINIGGWLVTEDWMCGFNDASDTPEASGNAGSPGRSALESLEARFGAEKATTLMNAWQDHWFTAKDLDEIRDGGFNLIRVPISYRTLQHADGSWVLNRHGHIDFKRMDWIVREAARRGLYTIFDLHVWPGQRVAYEKIGRPEGRATRESMARLWTVIAGHYRGNGAIAAFDLINEFPGAWGVQQVLSRAVRAGDPDRVQIIEGFTFAEFLNLHNQGEFPNSVFSAHFYAEAPLTTDEFRSRLKDTQDSPVPVYIGEFLAADFGAATQVMNRSKASWSSWTYKAVDMGNWGAFNYSANLKTDIQNDTFDAINSKWSTDLIAWQLPEGPKDLVVNENRRFATASRISAPLTD